MMSTLSPTRDIAILTQMKLIAFVMKQDELSIATISVGNNTETKELYVHLLQTAFIQFSIPKR